MMGILPLLRPKRHKMSMELKIHAEHRDGRVDKVLEDLILPEGHDRTDGLHGWEARRRGKSPG